MVYLWCLVVALVVMVILWVMISGISSKFNVHRNYFTGKGACITGDSWKRLPQGLTADTDLSGVHTMAAVFVGLLMVGLVVGLVVLVLVFRKLGDLNRV